MAQTLMASFQDEASRDTAVDKAKDNPEVHVKYIGEAKAVVNGSPSSTSWPFVIFGTNSPGGVIHFMDYGAIECTHI